MAKVIRTLIVIGFVGLVANCSEQRFSSVPSDSCKNANNNFGEGSCKTDPDTGLNLFSYKVSACKADILMVVDNSGSMYSEQTELADRFPGFLESIDNLEYNIAIVTTDISSNVVPKNLPDAQNGNGAFQDGKLIVFPDGKRFLKKTSSNKQSHFDARIKRSETLTCDNGGACPSGDERGIFAANLAVEKAKSRGNLGDNKFFRSDSHLAVVILSDENERSDGGNIPGYPLQERDLPETLTKTVQSTFGTSKLFSVHPIIVKPGDTACNNAQNAQQSGVERPRYGTLYNELGAPNAGLKGSVKPANIVNGSIGSICSSNYTPILEKISDSIKENVKTFQLACDSAENIQVFLGGNKLGSGDYTISNNRVTLNIDPDCQEVEVKYLCSKID